MNAVNSPPRGPAETIHAPLLRRLHFVLEPVQSRVFARLEGIAEPLTVVQLNLDTAVIRWPDPSVETPARAALDLRIGHADVEGLVARPLPLDAPGSMYRVLRFEGLTRDAGRRMLALLHGLLRRGKAHRPRTEARHAVILAEPKIVARQLKSLFRHRRPALIRRPTGAVYSATCDGVDDGPRPLRLRYDGPVTEAPVQLEVFGYNAVFRFQAASADVRAGVLTASFPDVVEHFRHRQRRRVAAPPGMCARLSHPLWPDFDIVRPVRDMGTTGFSIWTDPADDLLYAGLQLARVELLQDGAFVCCGAAVACHVTRVPANQASDQPWDAFAGFAFAARGEVSDRTWLAVVHRHLHPNARSGAWWKDFSWKVYERSGYFRLSGKQTSDFVGARPGFARTSGRMDGAPWLGIQAVWPSRRGVEATFTFVKIYKRSWFGFQLAKWPGGKDVQAPSKQVLLDLYLRAFEHMQHDPRMRWVAGYLEANVPWNEVAQFAWVRERDDENRVCSRPFRLLEFDLEAADVDAATDIAPGLTIEDATDADLDALCDHLDATRSYAWRDCLDLSRHRLDLADCERLWRAAGMHRERRIIAARRDGVTVAAAVMETGQDGVSLFSLLDGVRLFTLSDDGAAAIPALLGRCRECYAAMNKPRFCVFHEDGDVEDMLALGLKDLGPGRLWAVSREVLPDFLEHVHSLLAPSEPKKAWRETA